MKTGSLERSVEIGAPVELVYNAFTRFEDLPAFVDGVEEVWLADETHVRLCFRDGRPDAAAEIIEQRPFERVAWYGPVSGSVTFERLDSTRTRVTMRIESDRHDGQHLGYDLDRFKAVTEARES
jgi:uncharacterized membrane protein